MGFFKEFKEDLAQAVNELLPEDQKADEVNGTDDIEKIEADKELTDNDNLKSNNMEDGDETMDDNVDVELLQALNSDDEEKSEAKETEAIEEASKEAIDKDHEPDNKVRSCSVANEEDVTVITKGTTINGNISTDGSLDIKGTVVGDIECSGKLSITGHVKGNTKAAEVYINTERFEGGIISDGSVKVALGTVVVGDITGTSAVFAGAVKGEIDINGPVVIDSTSIIKGNIKAKSVQVNNGAIIDGFCSLAYSDVDIDNIFE